MSEEDINLERVVTDPDYRRVVIEFLNNQENARVEMQNELHS